VRWKKSEDFPENPLLQSRVLRGIRTFPQKLPFLVPRLQPGNAYMEAPAFEPEAEILGDVFGSEPGR